MTDQDKGNGENEKAPARIGPEGVREILSLSGSVALNRLLNLDHPEQFIRSMARMDFYWMVKRIGETDALPVLEMASTEQWEFLLDLEVWKKDRLDLGEAGVWVGRLLQADPDRLVHWLLKEGEYFTYYFFSKNLQVEFKSKDEMQDVAEGFSSLDGVYYLRILDPENEETLRNLLQRIASKDYERYQAILLALSGVLPAEVEEELYRRRNVRLAEDGFLPYEEAVSAYTMFRKPLVPRNPSAPVKVLEPSGEDRPQSPLMPILHVADDHLLLQTVNRSGDPLLLDRISLEFAGLCNRIFSAESFPENTPEALLQTVRKTAGYVNVGLERWCGRDLIRCEEVLRANPLLDLFRSGFSLALEIRWDTEKWLGRAWFTRQGFRPAFWGEEWGAALVGVVQMRPLLYDRSQKQVPYRPFESLEEIETCRKTLRRLMGLDLLIEKLAARYPLDTRWTKDPLFTFHSLLTNFWARGQLGVRAGFAPLSLDQIRDLFRLLRQDTAKPPYAMPGFRDVFVRELMAWASDFDRDAKELLRETLGILWDRFTEEYLLVGTADLDGRFLKFILSSPSPGSAPG